MGQHNISLNRHCGCRPAISYARVFSFAHRRWRIHVRHDGKTVRLVLPDLLCKLNLPIHLNQ